MRYLATTRYRGPSGPRTTTWDWNTWASSSGDRIDEFSRVQRAALTGQQFQSMENEPYYVLFEDFTHVKVYRHSLRDVCELQGGRFDGFQHVDDGVPQRIVTATGPNPLAR